MHIPNRIIILYTVNKTKQKTSLGDLIMATKKVTKKAEKPVPKKKKVVKKKVVVKAPAKKKTTKKKAPVQKKERTPRISQREHLGNLFGAMPKSGRTQKELAEKLGKLSGSKAHKNLMIIVKDLGDFAIGTGLFEIRKERYCRVRNS